MKRAALGCLLVATVILVVGYAPAASAHTELLFSTPAADEILSAPPEQVELAFSEQLLPETVRISVADETGLVIQVANATVDVDTVTLTWPAGLTGSAYDVNYRVVSQDGHPVSGTVSFTVTGGVPTAAAESVAPAPAATSSREPMTAPAAVDEPNALSPAVLALAAGLGVGLVAGVIAWIVTARRRGRSS